MLMYIDIQYLYIPMCIYIYVYNFFVCMYLLHIWSNHIFNVTLLNHFEHS